jgi:hypothetical protein
MHTQTNIHRQTDTQKQTDRQTDTHTHTCIHIYIHVFMFMHEHKYMFVYIIYLSISIDVYSSYTYQRDYLLLFAGVVLWMLGLCPCTSWIQFRSWCTEMHLCSNTQIFFFFLLSSRSCPVCALWQVFLLCKTHPAFYILIVANYVCPCSLAPSLTP